MDLSLQMQQKQTLSHKMQQSAEILQMNTLALSEYLREISEENPLLEWAEEPSLSEKDELFLQKLEWMQETDEQNRSYYQSEIDSKKEREDSIFSKKDDTGLREYLLFQINILSLEQEKKRVLHFLAECIEESGYLETGALEAAMTRFKLFANQAEEILSCLQSLDPPGVGARNLKECLLIQLRQKNASTAAESIVDSYLEEVSKNRLSYIAKKLRISAKEMDDALGEIKSCSPKPGSGFSNHLPVEYVLPDIYVKKEGTELIVTVNNSKSPHLYINPLYKQLLHQNNAEETKSYVMQKLRQAEWAVQCISRREETLLETTKAIVSAQKSFFLSPNGTLKPLRLQDIAEQIHVHESTVSRAVKDKYLQCDRGTFSLMDFFVKGLVREGECISSDHIRRQIVHWINTEDKTHPLSDRELTELLQKDGIDISRRTVAKYREIMHIPGAFGRKRYEG